MIKKVDLDNKAIEYIRNELNGGHDLASHLLKMPLETGHITTYLHDALNSEDIEGFNLSILLTKNLTMMKDAHEQMTDFISTYLQASSNRYAVFETNYDVGSNWLLAESIINFSYTSKVYHFITHEQSSRETIQSALKIARWYPFIGILVDYGTSIQNFEEISETKLMGIANSLDYLLIGAFDQEGFLIWSKA